MCRVTAPTYSYAQEKERKKGELKRLKNLKMKEIKGKLERIQRMNLEFQIIKKMELVKFNHDCRDYW